LQEYGWIEGQNLTVEWRMFGDRNDLLPEYVAELLDLWVEVLATFGSEPTTAARAATTRVPIVMLGVTDPIGQGLVSNLAHPDGNITGNTYQAPQLASKQLQLLHDIAPTARRIAFLWNPLNPLHVASAPEHHAAAEALGLELVDVGVSEPGDIEHGIAAITAMGAQALRVLSEGVLIFTNRSGWALPPITSCPVCTSNSIGYRLAD
jgi:putative ABC transport system substrate-binding protein